MPRPRTDRRGIVVSLPFPANRRASVYPPRTLGTTGPQDGPACLGVGPRPAALRLPGMTAGLPPARARAASRSALPDLGGPLGYVGSSPFWVYAKGNRVCRLFVVAHQGDERRSPPRGSTPPGFDAGPRGGVPFAMPRPPHAGASSGEHRLNSGPRPEDQRPYPRLMRALILRLSSSRGRHGTVGG
jgi:hypothetical protein